MNLLPTIVAKSDQLNADDLVGGPRTITVTGVKGSDSPEQPVWIHFEGDDGKPFKPCKTCRRLLVHCWGAEASDFIGRRMTLYTDPNVMFGGVKTGGIRISHVSHIEREMAVALMVTRGKRAPYVVKPLKAEVVRKPAPASADLSLDDEPNGAADGWDHVAFAQGQRDIAESIAVENDLRAWWSELAGSEDYQRLIAADQGEALAVKAAVQKRLRELKAD